MRSDRRGPVQFRVNPYTPGFQCTPAIAPGPDGGFVVAWASWGSGNFDPTCIYGRRFDSGGVPRGPAFHVNSFEATASSAGASPFDSDARDVRPP